MSRIFITGSSDGLGQLAAKLLVEQGHHVILHARNKDRANIAIKSVPGAKHILIADLSIIEEIKKLAADVNTLGEFDAIIHNAGVYQVPENIICTVNTIAPYILTCLIKKPKRLVYLSSSNHLSGVANLEKLEKQKASYSDSKLHVLLLSMATARKWNDVYSNALDPGWVPTKMGGAVAPDNLEKGFQTQTWLAVSNDNNAQVSGKYFYHKKEVAYSKLADDVSLQDKYLSTCEHITGVKFPENF